MKRKLLIGILTVISLPVFAQEKLDTLYYDRNGNGVAHKEFADYYRITLHAKDGKGVNKYRDFHINGRLMSAGEFISVDKNDDRNSKFIGTITIYDSEGKLSAIRNYKNGLLDGISEEYLSDGTLIQEEFAAGQRAKDHYVRYDKKGNIVKIRYSDNSIVWDSPLPSEISYDYHEGNKWSHYTKNGVTIALHTTKIKDYGKYHVMNITIDNNSLVPIEFEPSCNITASSTNLKKNETTKLKVYSCDEYMAKYDRRTAWGTAFLAINEALTVIDGGMSESKTVTVNNNGERSVSYTKSYSPFNHALEWGIAHMETKEYEKNVIDGREVRRVGYIKRTTVYPGESISGYAYVQRIKGNTVKAVIDIEGAQFVFTWNY